MNNFKIGFVLFVIGVLILLFNSYVQEWLPEPIKDYYLLTFAVGLVICLLGTLMMSKSRKT